MTRRRHRVWLLMLAIAVAVVTTAASAQAAGAQRRTPATHGQMAQADEPPENPCGAAGDGSAIVPDDCWGDFPSSHYDIGCDEGAWNNITRRVYCTFTDLAFQAARSTTAFSLWIVEWAYGFGVYERLGDPMVAIARSYETNLVGPLGLRHFAWTYAVAWAGIMALRGRLSMAAGELATSILMAALAAMLLANPAGYLDGAFSTMGSISGALLATGTGQPPPDNSASVDAVLEPLQAQIHEAFVEDPYDYLNWGGELTGDCAAVRDELLATGPHGNDDAPRQAMAEAGCDGQADWNHKPNSQRLYGAVLTLIAAVFMVVLVVLVSITIVVAQVMATALFAAAPFAAVGAVLTGGARELAWRWLASLVRVGIVVVGMSFVLSLLLLAVHALLSGGTAETMTERFVMVDVVVVAMFVARKRIIATGGQLAAHFGGRLSAHRAGGERAHTWVNAAATGGLTGFALGSSLGLDPRSRTGRLTSFIARDVMAERRMRRHYRRSERRALRPVARERTELIPNNEGEVMERRVITVDGPALAAGYEGRRGRYGPGASARARRARQGVEAAARRRSEELPPYQTPWLVDPEPDDHLPPDPPVDADEA